MYEIRLLRLGEMKETSVMCNVFTIDTVNCALTLFICSLSSLPALFYYAQHGYTDQAEVDIQTLKRNFGTHGYTKGVIETNHASIEGICGASFDDWVLASKVSDIKVICGDTKHT